MDALKKWAFGLAMAAGVGAFNSAVEYVHSTPFNVAALLTAIPVIGVLVAHAATAPKDKN